MLAGRCGHFTTSHQRATPNGLQVVSPNSNLRCPPPSTSDKVAPPSASCIGIVSATNGYIGGKACHCLGGDGGRVLPSCVAALLRRPNRKARYKTHANSARPPTPAPTPIPAFAAVERPGSADDVAAVDGEDMDVVAGEAKEDNEDELVKGLSVVLAELVVVEDIVDEAAPIVNVPVPLSSSTGGSAFSVFQAVIHP